STELGGGADRPRGDPGVVAGRTAAVPPVGGPRSRVLSIACGHGVAAPGPYRAAVTAAAPSAQQRPGPGRGPGVLSCARGRGFCWAGGGDRGPAAAAGAAPTVDPPERRTHRNTHTAN